MGFYRNTLPWYSKRLDIVNKGVLQALLLYQVSGVLRNVLTPDTVHSYTLDEYLSK